MNKLGIQDLDVSGKKVLVRVDFNVPLDHEGKITDDTRILASVPTISYLLEQGAIVILMSHLARPSGVEQKFSLSPCARRLSEIIEHPVLMAPDCIGPDVEKMIAELSSGEVLMLENLRFHPEEEEPERDPAFVKALASLGDLYVNDAFASAHRAHASTAMLAKKFPGKAAAGFLMEKELRALTPLLENPQKPFYAIIGGAKISTKAGVINHLLDAVDILFVAGAMANPFFKAKGIPIGDFVVSEEDEQIAKELLLKAQDLRLPIDVVIGEKKVEDTVSKVINPSDGIPVGWQILDIGPKTVEKWSDALKKAKTVFWNGPLGVFELSSFSRGTRAIAEVLSESKANVTVGGGDSIAAICQMGFKNKFTHLSTGGGASLEFLEYGHLPGIDALTNR